MKVLSLLESILLEEGKEEARRLLRRYNISENDIEEIINKLIVFDPTTSKKYLHWLVDKYIIGEEDLDFDKGTYKGISILELLNKFTQLQPKLDVDKRDINKYSSFNQLFQVISNVKSKSQEKKENIKFGSEIVFIDHDGEWICYRIFDYNASCLLGKGTKWCISANKHGKEAFKMYSKENSIYFLISRKSNEKYAILVNFSGEISEIYNSEDKMISDTHEQAKHVLLSILKDENKVNELISKLEPKDLTIENFISDYSKTTYTYDKTTDSYSVEGDVILSIPNGYKKILTKIPIKFNNVSGDFIISYGFSMNLLSLENSPKFVGNKYSCKYCVKIPNLIGAPKKVKLFECDNCNSIQNLEGAPQEVEYLSCRNCAKLKSLEHCPKKLKVLDASGSPIETLDYLPEEITQLLVLSYWPLRNKYQTIENIVSTIIKKREKIPKDKILIV